MSSDDSDFLLSEDEDIDPVKKNVSQDFNIDSNGIKYDQYTTLSSSQKTGIQQCAFCLTFYKEGMITNYEDQNVCYHCLFWLNFDENTRLDVDGVYGLTISQYILNCRDDHSVDTCQRSDTCFLCHNLNGIPILGIVDSHLIHADDGPREVQKDVQNGNPDDDVFEIFI